MMKDTRALLVFGACVFLCVTAFGLGAMLSSPSFLRSDLHAHEQTWVMPNRPNSAAQRERICAKKNDQAASALCAQWRATIASEESALWAKLAFFLTGLGSAGLLVTIVQGRHGLERAAEANAIARETSYNETRPWLNVVSVEFPLAVVGPSDCTVLCNLEIRNFGDQAASRVSVKAFLGKLMDPLLDNVLKGTAHTIVGSQFLDLVMPGQSRSTTLPLHVRTADIIDEGCGVFCLGIIVRYCGPAGTPEHILTQRWDVGGGEFGHHLQPLDPAVFESVNQVALHPMLRKTFRLT